MLPGQCGLSSSLREFLFLFVLPHRTKTRLTQHGENTDNQISTSLQKRLAMDKLSIAKHRHSSHKGIIKLPDSIKEESGIEIFPPRP